MRQAFTLLELMIFLALSSISIVLIMQFVSRVQKDSITINRKQNNHMRMLIALDVVRRDIWHASSDEKEWNDENGTFRRYNINNNKELIHVDVCWFIKKGNLVRMQGNYNYANKIWRKKRAGVVAHNVESFNMKKRIGKESYVKNVGVSYSLIDSIKKHEIFYLQNGII